MVVDENDAMIKYVNASGYGTNLYGDGVWRTVDGYFGNASFSGKIEFLINSFIKINLLKKGLQDISSDNNGNYYVAQYYAIRKINSSGYVETFAGSSVSGDLDGNRLSAKLNEVYAITYDQRTNSLYSFDSNKIKKISLVYNNVTTIAGNGTSGYLNGPALSCQINTVYGIFVHPTNGNVFFAQYNYHTIRGKFY